MPDVVELEQVTKSFGTQVAVNRLDPSIPEGTVYGFIGPNGSGKTTTIRMILRIFFPDTGRVSVLGSDHGAAADDRLGEVLLGSVNSTQLMGGKLLGNVAGSLTVFLIYGIAGFGVAWFNDVLDKVPWRVVPWFVLFHICAVLMFSGITMAFASAASNLQEAQGYMMLVWMPLIVPMFVWLSIVQNPNGAFATWFSLIPPVTPLTMVLRIAASSAVPLWQILIGVVLTVAFTVLCVIVAG